MTTRCARSYPRHACPLYVVVFMHLHDISKSTPVLAGISENDRHTIMRSHAPYEVFLTQPWVGITPNSGRFFVCL